MERVLRSAIEAGALEPAIWIIALTLAAGLVKRLVQHTPNLLRALDRRAAVRSALAAESDSDRDHSLLVLRQVMSAGDADAMPDPPATSLAARALRPRARRRFVGR